MNTLTDRFEFKAELPVAGDYDVVVCGGGPAGCMAAIQSARAGARTALIEKNGTLGGTTVVAAVDYPGLFHAWGKQVIAGIGWQVIEETVRRGGAVLPDFSVEPKRHSHHQVRVNRFIYSTVLDEFCHTAGVTVRLHEMPAAVRVENGTVWMVITGKTGLSVLRTRKLVDATGDADVVGLMGLPREKGRHLQPGTLIYRMSGYDPDKVDKERLDEVYQAALAAGEIFPTDHSSGKPPLWGELRSGGGNSMHVTGIDGSASPGRTTAEQRGRQALMRVYRLLRKVPGCENLRVDFAATECGVRETWRIVGEKFVDYQAYVSGRVWPDAVCYSFYPIDVHRYDDNTIDTRPLPRGIVPTIPYGALVPKGSDHLLAAGRCISGDAEASSAYRVQASAMATGQAAGAAAAIAAKKRISVRAVDLAELRAVLRANRAIVREPSAVQ